jgi:hypothetical protein
MKFGKFEIEPEALLSGIAIIGFFILMIIMTLRVL